MTPPIRSGVTKVYFPGVPTGPVLSSATVGGHVFGSRRGCDQHGDQDRDRADLRFSAQFYRMSAATAVTIKSITVVGSQRGDHIPMS